MKLVYKLTSSKTSAQLEDVILKLIRNGLREKIFKPTDFEQTELVNLLKNYLDTKPRVLIVC